MEVERQLFTEFLKVMHHSEAGRREFNRLHDCEEFTVHLAKSYSAWIVKRRELKTNEVFRMVLNFVSVMNLYRLFRVAIRAGDAVMIEWTYKEILSLYHITGKKHYVKIVLKQVEDLYNKISYKFLHLTRIRMCTVVLIVRGSQWLIGQWTASLRLFKSTTIK